jgi:hypothetical protein
MPGSGAELRYCDVPRTRFKLTYFGSSKETATGLVLTRMAAGIHTTPRDAHVVFDKVGDQYWLAEIWIPGEDGIDLHNTTLKHEHRIINVQVK